MSVKKKWKKKNSFSPYVTNSVSRRQSFLHVIWSSYVIHTWWLGWLTGYSEDGWVDWEDRNIWFDSLEWEIVYAVWGLKEMVGQGEGFKLIMRVWRGRTKKLHQAGLYMLGNISTIILSWIEENGHILWLLLVLAS